MDWVWASITIIFGIVVLLLCSMIRFAIVFQKEGKDDLFRLSVRALFGMIRFKYDIPVVEWKGKQIAVKEEMVNTRKHELKTEKKANINKDNVVKSYEQFRQLAAHALQVQRWMVDTLAHVRCHELEWETQIGLGDAPDTAFTTGLIWSLKCSLAGLVLNYVRLLEAPKLSVIPLFDEEHFEMKFRSRFSIRAGFLLWAGFHLFYRILRVKGGLKTWRKTLFRRNAVT